MTTKKITKDAKLEIINGVNEIAETISVTLGPSGKCVAIKTPYGTDVTRDGATVAKAIDLHGLKGIGSELVQKAASKTEEQAGDGTSTTSVLLAKLCKEGLRADGSGFNMNEVRSGMHKAENRIVEMISTYSQKIGDDDFDKMESIATISANNDPEVGKIVADCVKQVGRDGVITADVAYSLTTEVEITDGMELGRGWSSPLYVNSPADGKCVMENCLVAVIGERVSSVNQIVNLLQTVSESGSPLLLVCDDIDNIVNATIIANVQRGALRCCVVKGLDFGDGRKNVMEDLAIMTGATHMEPELGKSVSNITKLDLGHVKKVVVSKDNTVILGGDGDPTLIAERVEVLRSRLEDPRASDFDKNKFSKRLANMTGGIAVIRAGGASETEKMNRRATIEDSILATKSALTEGYVPGAGFVYIKAMLELEKDKDFWKSLSGDEIQGAKIVQSSLTTILHTISSNSGKAGDVVVSEVMRGISQSRKGGNYGLNAKTGIYCNLLEEGIIDSAKVVRVALQNAVSAASMILMIDSAVTEEETNDAGVTPDLGL